MIKVSTTVFEERSCLNILLSIFVLFALHSALFAAVDAAKVLGPESCGNCHRLEYDVWRKTRHFQLMDTLYKNPMAQQIAKKMGETLIKVDSICLDCHFTPRLMSGKLSATAGVSCESCHGAAKDWLNTHNDFGGMQATIKTETPEHRKQRVEAVQAAGMYVPEQLYRLAGNCFQCHTVQNEKLVNLGGHPSGSSFDLVSRAAVIRHNFIRGNRKSNPEAAPERKRLMYVIGYTLELEYGLRGAAKAKEDGRFLKTMSGRVKDAITELRAMKAVLSLPELDLILNAAQGIAIKANNETELMHVAQKVAAAGIAIAENNDGAKLAALDQLMTSTKEEEEEPAAEAAVGQPVAPGGAPGVKAHVRPPSSHKTVGPSNCSCHTQQNDWWGKDKHYNSSQPFLNDDPKRQKIARLYGVSSADMKTGKAICMDCHGTVISGKERREVEDGVSCESCHGAGADFLKVHNEGGKFNSKAFTVGMRELTKLDVRASVCTGCHYVTESRLLSAGHPSNEKFDYVTAMDKIKHWKAANDSVQIQAVFSDAVAKRGPVPKVELAKYTGPPPVEPGSAESGVRKSDGSKSDVSSKSAPPAGGAVKVGQKKDHILPPASGKVIGPGNCGGCHGPSNDWWSRDKHNQSAESFWDEKPKNVKIAAAYGISATDMKNGNNICMDCHGTVVSGKEAKEVADGVSCENCHGPAGAYVKVHNEGNKFNSKAFQLGMREVKKMDVRASLCTGCHYITDERLIASGHKSNANFDYVKAMDSIKHWKAANDAGAIKIAFNAALAKRGAIPKVAAAVAVSDTKEEEEVEEVEVKSSQPPKGQLPRPAMYSRERAPSKLPPMPEISEKTSLEELLKIIKKRIELLSQSKEGES